MRERLVYELAHTRGGVIQMIPKGRFACVRWRRLTPDVARFLVKYGREIESRLVSVYVDRHRPGWWLAWNVEQLMRNETPFQMPTTPLEIFNAKALLIGESPEQLTAYLDIPWCRADEFYIQKLALTLRAMASEK
jgi:hypothetical protein